LNNFKTVLKKKKNLYFFAKLRSNIWNIPFYDPFYFSVSWRCAAPRRPLVQHIWFDSGSAEPSVQLVILFPSISSLRLLALPPTSYFLFLSLLFSLLFYMFVTNDVVSKKKKTEICVTVDYIRDLAAEYSTAIWLRVKYM
jgi:hypothetical protein